MKKILGILGLAAGAFFLLSSFKGAEDPAPDPGTHEPSPEPSPEPELDGFKVIAFIGSVFVVKTNQPFTASQIAAGREIGLSFTSGVPSPGKYMVAKVYSAYNFSVYCTTTTRPEIGATGLWSRNGFENTVPEVEYTHGVICHTPGFDHDAITSIIQPPLNIGDEIEILSGAYKGVTKITEKKADNITYRIDKRYIADQPPGKFKIHKLCKTCR